MSEGKPALRVIGFPGADLREAPAGLRVLAGLMEKEKEHEAVYAMVVTVNAAGQLRVYSYGEHATMLHEIGVLQMAIQELCAMAKPKNAGS